VVLTFAPLFITPLPSVGIAPPSARFGTGFNVAPTPLAAAAPVILLVVIWMKHLESI
jgi:hypothetical protein